MKKIIIVVAGRHGVMAGERGGIRSGSPTCPRPRPRRKPKIKLCSWISPARTGARWCIKFKKEVLDTAEFQDYAAKNVVLVELDYPSKKVQSAELKKANAALKDQYNIHGYPTLVVLDKDGKEIGRQVGYSKGGPKAFIAKLESFKK